MLRLVTDLVTELGASEPELLAEQLVTLADGAASRALVLNDASYGRHARAAAATLISSSTRKGSPPDRRPPAMPTRRYARARRLSAESP